MNKFRALKADEVFVRAQSVKASGCILLLYKDSRCDMNILDETVGPLNWQREHSRDNQNCTVSIWDDEKKIWIGKEDTGVESYTEKEKGLAADSFKRACFNWGIGRELYTAPFIWVNLNSGEVLSKTVQGKTVYYLSYKAKFTVEKMEVNDGKITELVIVDGEGKVRYSMAGMPKAKTITKAQITTLKSEMKSAGIDEPTFCKVYKIAGVSELPSAKYTEAVKRLKAKAGTDD